MFPDVLRALERSKAEREPLLQQEPMSVKMGVNRAAGAIKLGEKNSEASNAHCSAAQEALNRNTL